MAQGVKSLQKAIHILDSIAAHGELGITEISQAFGITKSSVFNILHTFKENNWVEKNPITEKYRLGLRLFEIGNIVRSGLKLREIAVPFMKELIDETGETAHLTVVDNGQIVYIESAQPENKLSIASVIGRRVHMHCTGVGKAILAFQDQETIDDIIRTHDLPSFTPSTITDPQRLKDHLLEIQKKGYAVDNMEHEHGVKCVSAPIYNERGEVFASMSLSGPSPRFPEERVEEYSTLIINATQRVSKLLGWNRSLKQ